MKILMALEPFHQDQSSLKSLFKISKLLGGSKTRLETATVAQTSNPSLSLAFDVPPTERFTKYPLKLVQRTLKESGLSAERSHIIESKYLSTTKNVDLFLGLAQDRGADMISLFTHARQGYMRFVLGSFVETMLHRSKISLLILSPKMRVTQKPKSILMASDFGDSLKSDLKQAIRACQNLNSRLVVFHHSDAVDTWMAGHATLAPNANNKEVEKTKTWIESTCQKAGVQVEIVVSTKFYSTSELIMAEAKKKKAGLIVVSAKTGPTVALMGGSITRQVVRGSEVPVLVLK